MKAILIILGLIPLKTLGQQAISDSLLYSLTRQSIDNLIFGDVKLFYHAIEPRYLLDKENRILKDVAYFTDDDIQFLGDQISNPIIANWDNIQFKQGGNFSLVNALTNEECVYISVPLTSQDENVIVIYYEIRKHKKKKKLKSGSGTITVWTKTQSNQWIQQRQQIIWLLE